MNQSEHKINELEELIELAEKVSINIDRINKYIKNSTYFTIVFLLISIFIFMYSIKYYFYFIEYYDNLLVVFYFLGIIIFTGFLYKKLESIKNMRKEVENENLILGDLLNMIHAYKQVAYKDISMVKKAVTDMRLSRIKFHKQSPKNKNSFKKENIVPVQKKIVNT